MDLSRAMLERQVRAFYGTARQDALLGPVFARVQDWEPHIQRITDFWCNVALGERLYQGNPMGAHLALGLEGEHFARWLALWEQTAHATLPAAAAALVVERAGRIAGSMQHGVEVFRNRLPPAIPPATIRG